MTNIYIYIHIQELEKAQRFSQIFWLLSLNNPLYFDISTINETVIESTDQQKPVLFLAAFLCNAAQSNYLGDLSRSFMCHFPIRGLGSTSLLGLPQCK